MPLVIFDGPEAAGKSTLIDALAEAWGPEFAIRQWGPRDSWLEYCQPLFEDLKCVKSHPTFLQIWSRGWASRSVYNRLLTQGQVVPVEVTKALDDIVVRSGGLLVLVTAPVSTLLSRRLARIEAGNFKPDHSLDVHKELRAFQDYTRNRKWMNISGIGDTAYDVRSIIHELVLRNPECRMHAEEVDLAEALN